VKILLTLHQFFPEHRAGVEVVALSVARELKSRGHELHVLAPKRSIPGNGIRPGEVEDYEYGGIPVRRVGRPEEGPSRPYRLNYRNEVMARRAREYALEVDPDVVHVMHLQGLSASVLPVFEELGLPVVFTATDFWTVCPVVDLRRHDGALCEGPELHHCVRCLASRNPDPALKAKVARTPDLALKAAGLLADTPPGTPLVRRSSGLRQIVDLKERPAYIRERMRSVDHFVFYTRLARDLLAANGIGEGEISVSTYGIDTSEIVAAPRNEHVPPPLRVGFVGTVGPHKGPDLLVRAFGELPDLDATLTVHGELESYGDYAEELKSLAGDDGRISFPGPFSRGEIGRVLSETDVLVVPSRWYENAPGVILEAFAAGTPVVATDLGGLSELVRHEKNGLLFGLEDVEDLARQLRRLAEEPGLLERLRAGIRPVKTVAPYVDELERIYEGLIEKKARRAAATEGGSR